MCGLKIVLTWMWIKDCRKIGRIRFVEKLTMCIISNGANTWLLLMSFALIDSDVMDGRPIELCVAV